jgi:hypothetical protein
MIGRVARDHANFGAAPDCVGDCEAETTIRFNQIVRRVMQVRKMCELQFRLQKKNGRPRAA